MPHDDVYEATKSVPHSAADEWSLVQSALSLTVSDKSFLDDLSAASFHDPRLADVWRWAQKVHESGKSVTHRAVQVAAGATDSHPLARTLGRLQANRVAERPIHAAMTTVRDLGRLRELIATLSAAAEQAGTAENYSAALAGAHAALSEMEGDTAPESVTHWDDAVQEWRERLDDPDAYRIIETPWPDLNDKIAGGLHTGRTYVTGARPGQGKSLVGANLAQHAAENGHTALVFSAEMDTHEVTSRMLASGARAEYKQITRRQIDDYNYRKIDDYVACNKGLPLYIVDKADLTMNYIRATCRTMKRTTGLDVVVVDYLQLMRPDDRSISRERQIAEISRSLKVLARELGVAVVIACQLGRKSEVENREPRVDDLRESGSIEQDADVVILLHRNIDPEAADVAIIKFIIGKNRTGITCTVSLAFRGDQAAIR